MSVYFNSSIQIEKRIYPAKFGRQSSMNAKHTVIYSASLKSDKKLLNIKFIFKLFVVTHGQIPMFAAFGGRGKCGPAWQEITDIGSCDFLVAIHNFQIFN